MKTENSKAIEEPFTEKQELANTVIHALGILLGFVAVPFLITISIKNNDTNSIIGSVIYGICFLMTFTFSTMFHWCKKENRKCKLEMLDYISIYFLIAGTYTPFVLNFMPNTSGIILLCLVWGCTVAGTLFKIFFVNRNTTATIIFYLFTGLLFLIKCESFFAQMPYTIALLIITGVVLYVAGITFFVWKKWYYHHAIWHLFVLAASICHLAAVYLTVEG
ncbi:MAG: PAQR family membrane homeostasis protein TrhA [Ilyomonas sp.]